MIFKNGMIIKDSLILAQKSLERWANDLDVEHKKAVGSWQYDKIRNQTTRLSKDEKHYIENDTLAGVECIQKTMDSLGKRIYSIPYTATGIVREGFLKEGKKHQVKRMLKAVGCYVVYLKRVSIGKLMLDESLHPGQYRELQPEELKRLK